jgi:hypothetical protein
MGGKIKKERRSVADDVRSEIPWAVICFKFKKRIYELIRYNRRLRTYEIASEINITMGRRLAIGAKSLTGNVSWNSFRKHADIWASSLEKRTITC